MPLYNDENDFKVVEIAKNSDKTFYINDNNTVYGFADKLKALKQWVRLVLSTERYKYDIFSWNFGIETEDLYGNDHFYVISELKQRVNEALTFDDRITSVSDFKYTIKGGIICMSFIVHNIYESFSEEREFTGLLAD